MKSWIEVYDLVKTNPYLNQLNTKSKEIKYTFIRKMIQ